MLTKGLCVGIKTVPDSIDNSQNMVAHSRIPIFLDPKTAFDYPVLWYYLTEGCVGKIYFASLVSVFVGLKQSSCKRSCFARVHHEKWYPYVTLLCAQTRLFRLEYADNVVLLIEDPSKLQFFLDHLSNGVGVFGMSFAPLNCRLALHCRMAPSWFLFLQGKNKMK